VGLYFKGGAWGDLLLNDQYMRAAIRNHLLTNVRYYMSQDADAGTWSGPVPGLPGLSVAFDVGESIVKHLLGGGSLYMDATWTKTRDPQTGKVTLTLEAVFTYSDYMDLHPWLHPLPDAPAKLAEVWLKYFNLPAIFLGIKPQPYRLLISTDPVTIVMSWDPAKPGLIDFDF